MDVSENRGYPQIIHFNRVFHYKPSILGYHYFWKHPYLIVVILRYDCKGVYRIICISMRMTQQHTNSTCYTVYHGELQQIHTLRKYGCNPSLGTCLLVLLSWTIMNPKKNHSSCFFLGWTEAPITGRSQGLKSTHHLATFQRGKRSFAWQQWGLGMDQTHSKQISWVISLKNCAFDECVGLALLWCVRNL